MFSLDFREGRFKVDYQPMTFYLGGTSREVSGYTVWFVEQSDNKRGRKIQAINESAIIEYNKHMNELVESLYNYLISTDEDDKW